MNDIHETDFLHIRLAVQYIFSSFSIVVKIFSIKKIPRLIREPLSPSESLASKTSIQCFEMIRIIIFDAY